MSGYSNVTFDEIEIGATASAERVVGQTEIEALLLVSGDVVPFNLVEGVTVEPSDLCVEAVAAEAIISGMLERRLPAPARASSRSNWNSTASSASATSSARP